MANILVYIELASDRPTPASLEALGEGRRIATGLGAALHAFALVDEIDPTYARYGHDRVVTALGLAGADKVCFAVRPTGQPEHRWSPDGESLAGFCNELRPALVLLAATATGREIGPRLAARLGAAFIAEPSTEHGSRGEVVFSRAVFGASHRRRLAIEDLEQTAIVTLTPGTGRPEVGLDEAETRLIDPGRFGDPDDAAIAQTMDSDLDEIDPKADGAEHDPEATQPMTLADGDGLPDCITLAREPDPGAALDAARVVVVAGGGIADAADYELVCDLAAALGGEPAATRAACERGLAPPEREVGVGARHLAPELYIVCGASGSAAHLGAIARDAEIIAINTDPDAPIFCVADYGIVGAVADVIPALIDALEGHSLFPAPT